MKLVLKVLDLLVLLVGSYDIYLGITNSNLFDMVIGLFVISYILYFREK